MGQDNITQVWPSRGLQATSRPPSILEWLGNNFWKWNKPCHNLNFRSPVSLLSSLSLGQKGLKRQLAQLALMSQSLQLKYIHICLINLFHFTLWFIYLVRLLNFCVVQSNNKKKLCRVPGLCCNQSTVSISSPS